MSHEIKIPTLGEFYEMLERHDWFACMSDDSSVADRGERAERQLINIVNATETAKDSRYGALFRSYHAFMWSGPAFGTEQPPKPAAPESADTQEVA
jgi:hypothetical protein